jgi:hypothetical protein
MVGTRNVVEGSQQGITTHDVAAARAAIVSKGLSTCVFLLTRKATLAEVPVSFYRYGSDIEKCWGIAHSSTFLNLLMNFGD